MAGLPQEVRAKAASPDSQAKEKKEESLLYSQLNIFFPLVTVAKTSFSRNSSIEVSEVSKSCLLTPSSLGLRGVSELQSAPRLHAHHAQPSPGPQGTSQAPAHSVI